jgi:hypothetical protein
MTKAVKHNENNNLVVSPNSALANLNELFADSLKDIYWAENALVSALLQNDCQCYGASLIPQWDHRGN